MSIATLIREDQNNGPDATHLLRDACPKCSGDVEYQRVIQWRFYPEGNGFTVDCFGCGFSDEVIL
jgi:hypothetical protein